MNTLENTKKTDRRKSEYISRPLTETEREFASREENHNCIYTYCHMNHLDVEEWYDRLIFGYLNTVKLYVTEKPELQRYAFSTILFKKLIRPVSDYYRDINREKRMPKGGICSLDFAIEEDHGRERQIEPWWIDPMQNVERYVVEKEFLNDIYSNIYRYAEPDLLKLIVDMRQEGYSNREIARKAVVVIEDYQGWGIREVTQIIVALTKTRNSALQRLYRDTAEYGNIDSYQKWEDARENW